MVRCVLVYSEHGKGADWRRRRRLRRLLTAAVRRQPVYVCLSVLYPLPRQFPSLLPSHVVP